MPAVNHASNPVCRPIWFHPSYQPGSMQTGYIASTGLLFYTNLTLWTRALVRIRFKVNFTHRHRCVHTICSEVHAVEPRALVWQVWDPTHICRGSSVRYPGSVLAHFNPVDHPHKHDPHSISAIGLFSRDFVTSQPTVVCLLSVNSDCRSLWKQFSCQASSSRIRRRPVVLTDAVYAFYKYWGLIPIKIGPGWGDRTRIPKTMTWWL